MENFNIMSYWLDTKNFMETLQKKKLTAFYKMVMHLLMTRLQLKVVANGYHFLILSPYQINQLRTTRIKTTVSMPRIKIAESGITTSLGFGLRSSRTSRSQCRQWSGRTRLLRSARSSRRRHSRLDPSTGRYRAAAAVDEARESVAALESSDRRG